MAWYVVQTLKGREYRVAADIRNDIAGEAEPVFILENELEYKIKKEWIRNRKPLFPGYIFVDIDKNEAEDFNKRLHTKFRSLKLMDVGGTVTPIKPEEEEYLLQLGGEEHIILHSAGFRVDDMVEITSGSFKGYQGEIRKLDRHNRRAKICLPLMGRNMEVEIGLEIVKNVTSRNCTPDGNMATGKIARIVTA